MIVVGDTGPLNYLVLIGQADVLPVLFSRVVIPEAVVGELSSIDAPHVVREWMGDPPGWLETRPDPADDDTLSGLDPGERAAIALALQMPVPQILMDDRDGRTAASRRKLKVTGTLGVLIEAHRRGLLDFETALLRLSATSFYISQRLIERARELL
jgi:predicted nucleic acid-binding protein